MTTLKHFNSQVPVELRALNLNYPVAVFDTQAKLVRANKRYCELTGCHLDERIGTYESDQLERDADRQTFTEVWQTTRQGDPATHVAMRRMANGESGWIKARYTPMEEDGEVFEIVAIYEDITADRSRQADNQGQVEAINRSQCVVHFDTDGTIRSVNDLFLEAVGYDRDELVGQHHRLLVDPVQADSEPYRQFWANLAAGRHYADEFRRIRRDGEDVWLQASYNPIFDPAGRVTKIVKYATDVTDERLRQAEYQWQISAIHKSHAVIVFDMHGTIIDANSIFLDAVGYTLEEIQGQHHRIFVEPSYAHSIEYSQFWRALQQGEHKASQYKRLSKAGRAIWLQATYNPIFDMNDRPVKVVKYASIVTDDKLQQADHQGQIAAIHKAHCVVSFDLYGNILDANENFLELMGYCYAEVRGRHHAMFVETDEAQSDEYHGFWASLRRGEHHDAEFKRLDKQGREVWLQATYNPIFDMNGQPFKIVKYATDITQEKFAQADYRSQIEAINKSQGVVELALDGTILSANENFLQTFGYGLDDVQNQHHSMLLMPGVVHSAEYRELWETLRSGTFHSGLYKRAGRNGKEIWLQATYNPVLDLNGRPYKIIKFATDVSANIAMAHAYDEASRMAQHDATTGLPNRLKLANFMTSALPHPAARLVVLYIDLDHFKPINDTYGHETGDRVLGEVADRLRRCLQDDHMVARNGGDEFVVAAPALEHDEIEPLCQRILDTIAEPIHYPDGDLHIAASIGIAVSPLDGTSLDELLKNADTALYRSKSEGRDTYHFYTEEMNEQVAAYRAMTEDMRRGLTSHEFTLEYQPRFDTKQRRIRSVEALIRWAHPEKGYIGPGEFIPLAEQNGLIIPLSEWVLETACKTVAEHSDEIGVSVNISPVQFQEDRLVETVSRALAESGLAPERLELEITEGVLLSNADHAKQILSRIKALGVRLAMDDFGTGYSSLSYLRSFPFDVIKIDRQFINDLEDKNGTYAIVKAILSLGSALGVSVTAEGVETNEQLDKLTTADCAEVQGFLLARPMPIAALHDMMAKMPQIIDRGEEKLVFSEDPIRIPKEQLDRSRSAQASTSS